MRPQKIAPRHIEIASVDEAAIAFDERLAVQPIESRNLIPGQSVSQMMHRMKIVEEKERPEDPGVFDNRGAALSRRVRFGSPRPKPTKAILDRKISSVCAPTEPWKVGTSPRPSTHSTN